MRDRNLSTPHSVNPLFLKRGRIGASAAGMTLIEVVVVVAVMGIMLAFSADSFEQMYANSKLRSAQDSVAQFLRKARNYADAHATGVAVAVAANSLTLTSGNGNAQETLRLPAGVTASSTGTATYSFKPRGTVGAGTITLSIPGLPSRLVVLTGYAHVRTEMGL